MAIVLQLIRYVIYSGYGISPLQFQVHIITWFDALLTHSWFVFVLRIFNGAQCLYYPYYGSAQFS